MSRGYRKALAEAKENMADVLERGEAAIGDDDAVAYLNSLLTPEEKAESDLRVSLISEFVKARQEKGLSQKKLEELSGVKQPIIARMETGATSPQLDTILKVLAPLGKTLAIVPLEKG